MRFVRAVWKLLVGVKDVLVLIFMLMFFGLLYAALSSRPAPVGDGDVLNLGPYRLTVNLSQQSRPDEDENTAMTGLADTVSMPAGVGAQSTHLKVIK